jgi:glycine betaine/proline transport system substrate-binding protein
MKKVIMAILIAALTITMLLGGCGPQEPEAKPTIVIGDNNWGSAHFLAEMQKIIIEHGYGYPVELVPGKTVILWEATKTGDVDVDPEVWRPNMADWDEAISGGELIDLAIINEDNWQSLFVVPTYMIEGDASRGIDPMTPELQSVDQLSETKYKELFADPESPGKGRIFNCLPGWECELINERQLKAYGLDEHYNLVNPGSQEALFANLIKAYQNGEPYITYLWGPTWIAGKLDLTRLEEPAHNEQDWETDNSCAYPSAELHVVAHPTFPEKAPDVTKMYESWYMETAYFNEALAYMDETGGEPFDAALWFLKEREEVWTKFVPDDVAQKVKEAVASGIVAPPTTAE